MLSSRAWLIDLLHSIGEKLALCDHLAEKLDDENARELYFKVLEERRKEMRILANYGENTNLEYWCALKHSLKAFSLFNLFDFFFDLDVRPVRTLDPGFLFF